MKLGKFVDGEMDIVAVENGKEVRGKRTEVQLYVDGYEKLVETGKPFDEADVHYIHVCGQGWIQTWDVPQFEPTSMN